MPKRKPSKRTSERTQKEKAYVDKQEFHHFIDQDLDDKEYYKRYDAIEAAFKRLVDAKVILSKSQFTCSLVTMQRVLVPINDAAAICQTTREYFRVLEKRGKLIIVRPKGSKKCFITPNDIFKYLTGKNKSV